MTGSQRICKRSLKEILPRSVEGEPQYWYGVIDGYAGALWDQLFVFKSHADKAAKDLDGYVVIVSVRVLEDEEGDYIEPAN